MLNIGLLLITGTTISKVLAALDALDRHSFDGMNSSNSLETLYSKVFSAGNSTSTLEARERQENVSTSVLLAIQQNFDMYSYLLFYPQPVNADAPVVQLLCEWAVSTSRWGEHRAMAVAKLLERRQADLAQACEPSDVPDDKDSAASSSGGGGPPPGLPVFQQLLMHFLDTEAPVLGNYKMFFSFNNNVYVQLYHILNNKIPILSPL